MLKTPPDQEAKQDETSILIVIRAKGDDRMVVCHFVRRFRPASIFRGTTPSSAPWHDGADRSQDD
jgi:hypothetical protein